MLGAVEKLNMPGLKRGSPSNDMSLIVIDAFLDTFETDLGDTRVGRDAPQPH
jgi:hypothetical protein